MAERVALGKRRREQLGIQTASDMQNTPAPASFAAQSAAALPSSHGIAGRPGPDTVSNDQSGSSGKAVRPAEGMMAKWGYTRGVLLV